MRNLVGFRFPSHACDAELGQILQLICAAELDAGLGLEILRGLTTAERDHLVSSRLVSHDFPWTLPYRAILLDPDRSVSLMVNEEDHLRIQALCAGWSLEASDSLARRCAQGLGGRIQFARHPEFGYLSASPYNCGAGRRRSAMVHLIGLAQSQRLPAVLRALDAEGLSVRGLFGEASRAIGAFVQISAIRGDRNTFSGACEYLIREERAARSAIGTETLRARALQARDFAVSSVSLPLDDALRALGWIRWAAAAGIEGFDLSPREADAALATFELRGQGAEPFARQRADVLRTLLDA
jgi:protein arginine kinase